MTLPAWLAATMQLPAANADTVLPLVPDAVQIVGVVLVKVTALPDAPPVAVTVAVPPTTNTGAIPKVMDWDKASPCPLRLMLCGLPVALSVMVTAPTRLPVAVGVNVTLKSQKPPAPKPEPQLLVTEKSPLAVILVRLSAAPPLLVSLTTCAALLVPIVCAAKLSEVGLSEATGTATPVPFKPSVMVPLAESLLITKLPVRAPAAVGEKVTVMAQLAAGSKVLLQVVDLAKSPLIVTPLMLRMSPPVLVSVYASTLLAPILVLVKKLPIPDGGVAPMEPVSEATAPCPEPLRLMVCGLPGALLVMVNVPVRLPVAVGVKLTFSVQNPDTPRPLPQLLVTEKSPVVAMLLMVRAAVPVLVNETL